MTLHSALHPWNRQSPRGGGGETTGWRLTASSVIVISGQPDIPAYLESAGPRSRHNNNMRSRRSGVLCVTPRSRVPGGRQRGKRSGRLIKRSSIIVQLCRLINPPAIMLPLSLSPFGHLDRPRVSFQSFLGLSLILLLPSVVEEPPDGFLTYDCRRVHAAMLRQASTAFGNGNYTLLGTKEDSPGRSFFFFLIFVAKHI